MILEGRHPARLTLTALIEERLLLAWDDQRAKFQAFAHNLIPIRETPRDTSRRASRAVSRRHLRASPPSKIVELDTFEIALETRPELGGEYAA